MGQGERTARVELSRTQRWTDRAARGHNCLDKLRNQ
jgi:hypothetical protein